ncbi:MAG: deoxyribodipyrimidine photo-lyase [Methanobacteriaceae archaeon]
MIQKERIKLLSENDVIDGNYVLYWMQASVRAHYNHALEYAVRNANKLKKPLLVYFGLIDDFPEANQRHYYFLLEGLKETQQELKKKDINMVVQHQEPVEGALKMAEESSLLVTDRGYLPLQRQWRQDVAEGIECPMIQVESDVVVPVETASPKEEYMAGTIRRKIQKQWDYFLVPLKMGKPHESSLDLKFDTLNLENTEKILTRLKIDDGVGVVDWIQGGNLQARNHLNYFLKNKLDHFGDLRNDPTRNYLSNMSPYLHFGQISPLYIALQVLKTRSPGVEGYLEELIIRRELSMNFVFYDSDYDNFNCLPAWAQKTLLEHARDQREYEYTVDELEIAQTHDPYWNAAQKEMVHRGKMHGYMRMYWGKKILEWTRNPMQAYHVALYLNNKYELDGRDPNGYTGVAWCFGKHDRAWKEREIFGKVRYMNDKGLRRKFRIDRYVERIENTVN